MSREIRFRAWDGDLNRMFVDGEPMPDLCIDLTGKTFAIDPGFAIYEVNKIELMQFTGLQDRNGVDIYEGDVLKAHGIVVWNNEEHRWSAIDIVWNDKREWHDLDYLTSPFEVIGNIHQNKELLEVKS